MPSNRIVKLDVRDKKILQELERNARQSNRQIAKKVSVNPDLVRYRINNLQKEGVISHFLAYVNFAKLGLTDYGIFLSTQKLAKEKETEFVAFFERHPQVSYFAKTGGRYDFIVGVLARDILHFHETLSGMLDSLGEYIANKDIAIRVMLQHFPRKYMAEGTPSESASHFGGPTEICDLDGVDKHILKKIATNARIENTVIARELSVPLSTVALRIKKLQERGIINGFFVVICPQSYGFQEYDLMLSCKNMAKEDENKFCSFCKRHPNMTYLIKTVGRWNYEIGIEVPDQQSYQEVLSELRNRFSEFITATDFVIIFKTIKYTLYPL